MSLPRHDQVRGGAHEHFSCPKFQPRHSHCYISLNRYIIHMFGCRQNLVIRSPETMSATQTASTPQAIPVLLLKTKSSPGDAYEETFSNAKDYQFLPRFIPVLQHKFIEDGLADVAALLKEKKIGGSPGCTYGGMIFTSQRAVEAFASVIEDGRASGIAIISLGEQKETSH